MKGLLISCATSLPTPSVISVVMLVWHFNNMKFIFKEGSLMQHAGR
jgi:hypothetical protein